MRISLPRTWLFFCLLASCLLMAGTTAFVPLPPGATRGIEARGRGRCLVSSSSSTPMGAPRGTGDSGGGGGNNSGPWRKKPSVDRPPYTKLVSDQKSWRPRGGEGGGAWSSSQHQGQRRHSHNHHRGERKSAAEEYLIILSKLRAEAGQVAEHHQSVEDGDAEQENIAEVINLVRAMASEDWAQAQASALALCRSPLMDVMLARMLLTAATQSRDPELGLKVLAGMHERRVYPDPYILALILKSTAVDMAWMSVVEVIKSQLASIPGGLPQDSSRRHHGFLRALSSAVERGKFFSSSFLVDALLHFSMIDLFTLKVALKFYRFSKTPARALPWISAAKGISLLYDEDLAFEIGRVYKSLGMWREGIALLDEMVRDRRLTIDDKHIGVVFSTCHGAGEWQESLRLLDRLKEARIPLGSIPCLILLRLLLENRKVDQAKDVLVWMGTTSTPLDQELARLVLLSLAKTGPVESCVDFITKLMPVAGVQPDINCFTSVLRACSNFARPDSALEVFAYLKRCGITPDVLSCVSVIDALMDANRYEEALSFYAAARADGMRPDIKCYTQVLRLVALAERWDLFQTYVQEAVKDSRELKIGLDLRFFATVINACAEAGRPDEALSVLSSLGTYGLTPNIFCYGAAAKACLTKGRWREALALLDDARSNDVPPDPPLYRAVLRCCWQARQWQSVVRLCAEMHLQGLPVDEGVYLQLMDTLARAGQTELAMQALEQMVISGFSPSETIVSGFLRGHYEKGEYGEAWEQLMKVKMRNRQRPAAAALRIGSTALQDLMTVCVRREDWEEVLELAKRWATGGDDDTGVSSSSRGGGGMPMMARAHLARAHAELNQWKQAEEYLSAMERDLKLMPSPLTEKVVSKTYTVLLNLCARRIVPKQAMALLDRMKAATLPIDADSYHFALDACAQTGLTEEVWSLFEEMRATPGLTPGVETYTIMLELCTREGGRSEDAIQLMDELEAAGLEPDIICFNAAMNAVREAAFLEGDPDKTARLRSYMSKWRAQETMHTYNSEIAVMAIQRSLQEGASTALRLIREMADNGIPWNVDSFNMALEVCSRANDVGAAVKVFEELQSLQGRIQPDAFTYLTTALVLIRNGREEEGIDLLERMMDDETTEQITGSQQQRQAAVAQSQRRRGGSFEAYYTMLWPQTFKQVNKALLILAEGSGARRCPIIVRVMGFLKAQDHDPPFDAESLAEQLASRGLCTSYLSRTRLTGGALDIDLKLQPQPVSAT